MDHPTRRLLFGLVVICAAAQAFWMLMGGATWPWFLHSGQWWGRGWGWGWGWGMGSPGGLTMLIFWAGVVAALAWLARGPRPVGRGASEPSPSDILQRRYAKGEVSRDEYEQIRRDLEV